MELLYKTNYINEEQFNSLETKCKSLRAILVASINTAKELVNLAFGLFVDNTPLILLFFAIAAPLGLNAVVFPEAYGGDPETGAPLSSRVAHDVIFQNRKTKKEEDVSAKNRSVLFLVRPVDEGSFVSRKGEARRARAFEGAWKRSNEQKKAALT